MAGNCDRKLRLPRIHFRVLLHAANMRHGTNGFTYPPKEGVLRIFFVLKNPTASAGFEPANLGTKGQHATSRPPKPHFCSKTYMVTEIFLLASMCNLCMKQRISWKANRSELRDFPRFLKRKYMLPCPQEVTTGPYFELLEASPRAPILFL